MARHKTDEVDALNSEITRLVNERNRAVERRKTKVRDTIESLLRESNYTLSDLYGARPMKSARYVNPSKPTETWGGRGRRPEWLSAKLSAGAKLEDFETRLR